MNISKLSKLQDAEPQIFNSERLKFTQRRPHLVNNVQLTIQVKHELIQNFNIKKLGKWEKTTPQPLDSKRMKYSVNFGDYITIFIPSKPIHQAFRKYLKTQFIQFTSQDKREFV